MTYDRSKSDPFDGEGAAFGNNLWPEEVSAELDGTQPPDKIPGEEIETHFATPAGSTDQTVTLSHLLDVARILGDGWRDKNPDSLGRPEPETSGEVLDVPSFVHPDLAHVIPFPRKTP